MRRVACILSAITLSVAALALAAPSQAADLSVACTDNVGGSVTASGSTYTIAAGSGCSHVRWTYTVGSSGITVTVLPSTAVAAGLGGETSFTQPQTIEIAKTGSATSVTVSLSDGAFGFSTFTKNIVVSFTGGGGGGGGSSSSTSAPAPVLETLTLQVSTSSTTCTGGSPTGYTGSWLQMPAADACSQSGPNANPKAKLLGWATDPIFPVAVAQQIVDLKYGPIDDYFYGMRMIFIPAGGWTYVSGSNNLYPIWSS